MKEDGSINLSANDYLEQDYLALENVAETTYRDHQYLADNFCLNDDDLDIVETVLHEVYRSKHPELFKGARLSPEVAKQAIQENRRLLESINLLGPVSDVTFKTVYQRVDLSEKEDGDSVRVYGVHEIFEGDNQKQVEEARPQWCDLLISYVVKRNPNAKNIYLFLHDKDIAGFSSSSLTLVDGANDCCQRHLIQDTTLKMLDNKVLSIVFFKHGNAMITELIGPFTEDTVIDGTYIMRRIKAIIDYLRGVYGCRKLADSVLEEENRKEKLSQGS